MTVGVRNRGRKETNNIRNSWEILVYLLYMGQTLWRFLQTETSTWKCSGSLQIDPWVTDRAPSYKCRASSLWHWLGGALHSSLWLPWCQLQVARISEYKVQESGKATHPCKHWRCLCYGLSKKSLPPHPWPHLLETWLPARLLGSDWLLIKSSDLNNWLLPWCIHNKALGECLWLQFSSRPL